MKKQWGLNYSSLPLWNNSFLEKQIHFSWAQALNVLPASKTTFLVLTQFATHSYPLSSRYLFSWPEINHTTPYIMNCMDFFLHWRHIYAFTVSICTTSKISAWRQGNTVTNCNNSRPGAISIHDTGCYVLFLFSDSREQRQTIGMLYMDLKNRMLRPFIWCVQRDYYSIHALWWESFFQTSRCDLENCSSSLILYPNYWLVAFRL